MQSAARASIMRHLCSFICKAKVFINREKNEESPGEQSQGCVCGGGEWGKGPGEEGRGPGDPAGAAGRGTGRRGSGVSGGSCRVKVSLFSVKRGWSCGHPSKARLCCGSERKVAWEKPVGKGLVPGETSLGGLPEGAPGAGLHFHAFSEALGARDVFLINF